MRRLFRILGALLLLPAIYVISVTYAHADLGALPQLESGDLIFETALDPHLALPIMVSTFSLYTHVGVIRRHPDGSYSVIHASEPVQETPLAAFIKTSWGERFTVLRYPHLTKEQQEGVAANAAAYLGRHYNGIFYMKSDAIYCSELPYLAFQAQGLKVGNMQKTGDLHVNNFAVRRLFMQRWRMHPLCSAAGSDFDTCWKTVMDQPIITPASLAHDPNLARIYSNYLF